MKIVLKYLELPDSPIPAVKYAGSGDNIPRRFLSPNVKFSFAQSNCPVTGQRTLFLNTVVPLWWVMLLLISFFVVVPCSAEQATSPSVKPSPDIWYRSFEGEDKIADIFFSDRDVWGEEPVVILRDDKTGLGTAVGFFSGKRLKVYSTYDYNVKQGGPDWHMYHYYDARTKRELERRYIPPQKVYESSTKTCDGGSLNDEPRATMVFGEIFEELFPQDLCKKLSEDTEKEIPHSAEDARKIAQKYRTRLIKGEITYAPVGVEIDCEPIKWYLVKRDKNGKLIWAKSFVRFYPERATAPKQTLERCLHGSNENERIRIASSTYLRLLLSDGTMLVGTPDAVARIRQVDGEAPPLVFPATFRILDAVDVIKAKLDLMQKEAAVQKKCAEEGKDLWASPECGLYRTNEYDEVDRERMHLDLGRRFFNINP